MADLMRRVEEVSHRCDSGPFGRREKQVRWLLGMEPGGTKEKKKWTKKKSGA